MAPQKLNFGKEAAKEFLFAPNWRNLNHGSFGTVPKAIQDKHREYQSLSEARPDLYVRELYPRLLDESRAALASVVNCPTDELVFVPNVTTGANAVLKGLTWNPDGKDTTICFSTVYGSCGKVQDWLVDHNRGLVSSKQIELRYPLENEEIIQKFRDAVKEVEAQGKRARIAVFDVITAGPGVCFPWQEMVKVCKELGILSFVDGAHGVGIAHIDLTAADPDFFLSNCHKWLHVPRGCAMMFVPKRNQALLNSTAITSHSYVSANGPKRSDPLPYKGDSPSDFVKSWTFTGTVDSTPYLCVKDAIQWRKDTFGGEEAIIAYQNKLNKEGSALMEKMLGGKLLQNKEGTLMECALGNILLPMWVGERPEGQGNETDVVVPADDATAVTQWMHKVMMHEYDTFLNVAINYGRYVVRMSAQVYLDQEDYEWAANTLLELIERVRKGEYKQ